MPAHFSLDQSISIAYSARLDQLHTYRSMEPPLATASRASSSSGFKLATFILRRQQEVSPSDIIVDVHKLKKAAIRCELGR